MRAVLVTGATSFLGVRTVARLKDAGIVPHAVVRPRSDLSRLTDLPDNHRHLYDGSIDSLVTALSAAKADAFIHIAGAYVREHAAGDVARLLESNIRFGSQLLEAMRAVGPSRLVNAGSAFQHFNSNAYVPLNFYAATKQALADILAYYAASHGFSAATITLPDVYGARDWRPKIMNRIVASHLHRQSLDMVAESTVLGLVHVDDASDAFLHCANLLMDDPSAVAGREFGVDQGNQYSLGEIVSTVAKHVGHEVAMNWGAYPAPDRHVERPWRGEALPGWRPKIGLDEGVRRLVDADAEAAAS